MNETITTLLGLISMIGFPIALIGFFIQLARKKPNKKIWAIAAIGFVVIFVVFMFSIPDSEPGKENSNSSAKSVESTTSESQKTAESEKESSTNDKEKSEAERFAEENDTSVHLAESLESVLDGMELTDKSRVGAFHYSLSDVYEWSKENDWAEGERYSAYMDMEHVWYIYVKDDTVVGIRDGNGNVYYSAD
jgi:hypothetical protein